MSTRFEELARRLTALGEISLRRRRDPALGVDVYEVKLDDEFLMSSLFTTTEIALATLGLAAARGDDLDVVVGGLGLGYTARAVLSDPRVRSLVVVDALAEVITWHEEGLIPLGPLTEDPRCTLVHDDFFAAVAAGGFASSEPTLPTSTYDAILVDIDHSPTRVLHPSHAAFYTASGLRAVAALLRPGGVFSLWSDDAPDADFVATAEAVFASCEAEVVSFANPYSGDKAAATIYVATTGARSSSATAPSV